jgi:RNA polymerase sigma factor (sigma-70 family)
MASDRHEFLARQMRVLFSMGVARNLTDAELLEQFARGGGEAAECAFAQLVERHGPMVLRVCRQVLRDGHAAEDAFQAAFLVLARRGSSLHAAKSLAPWLQQVAWRTASRLRGKAARRRMHEERAAAAVAQAAAGVVWDDLGPAVHEEICRLPARYRVPIVLCYLEGLTALQVAQQLGWPPGTVRSRLARGRERLRARLTRRGLAPSAAVLVAALAADSAWAAVPAQLADRTTRGAILVAAGRVAAGAIPASILSLTEGVLETMFMSKLKLMTTVLAVGLATTALALAQSGGGIGPGPQAKSADPLIVGKIPLDSGGHPFEATKRPANDVRDQIAGPSQSDATRDSSRLEAVERKLDRILQALGAIGPPEQRQPTTPAEPQPKVAAVDREVPDPIYQRTPVADPADAPGAAEKRPFLGRQMRDLTGIQARLGRVEQTLDDLLERVRRLEDRAANESTRHSFGRTKAQAN